MPQREPTRDERSEAAEVEKWLGHVSAYERAFKKWEARSAKIIKRYRDERGDSSSGAAAGARFNILWANVQTLSAATFAHLPKPDVSRRFRDHDPVGRVASLTLERALEYEVDHYPDYRATMKASVLDRFLGGRASAWARYEPHMKAAALSLPVDGLQVTEDSQLPNEELDYECAPTDYVYPKDFGHMLARNWEEVTAVWRKVYLGREALVERFGEIGNEVPLDAKPEHLKESERGGEQTELACVLEIWDKDKSEALWISKSLNRILDRRDDPLGLEDFYPCPKPLYATLANDSLVPTPDFALYQYQADQLDTLALRIEGLIGALKVMGVYDASITEIGRLFSEGENTGLFPVKNWASYAEKGKLTGAIELVDLKPIYEALRECYMAMDQIKQQIYEITRISDIMRGVVNPREKLGQTEMKGQYGNLGIKAYQDEIAQYATELLRIKAQIICNKFSPETIVRISAVDQLSDFDKALLPQAMQLLIGERAVKDPMTGTYPDVPGQNPLRSFRIEIAADSLVHIDEDAEKDSRMSFIAANSAFIKDTIMTLAQAGPMAAPLTPLIMEVWKFGVTGFKVGKMIEGAFDEATEKVRQLTAAQPQIPPEFEQKMQQMQEMLQKLGDENQQLKTGAAEKTLKVQSDHQTTLEGIGAQERKDMAALAAKERIQNQEIALDNKKTDAEIANKRRMAEVDAEIARKKVADAKMLADDKLAFDKACREQDMEHQESTDIAPKMDKLLNDAVNEITKTIEEAKPVSIKTVKDAAGRITGGVATYANGETRNVTIQ
jgi:hypothetical protein